MHSNDGGAVLFLSPSLPWAAQDLRWGLAGQAAQEDAGHEGKPSAGLRRQVGLREGPVEVKTLPPAGGLVSCRSPKPLSGWPLNFWPSCCTCLLLSSNKHISNQPVLVCHLFTFACVQATKACKLIAKIRDATWFCNRFWKSDLTCTSRLTMRTYRMKHFIIFNIFYRMTIYSHFFLICIRSGPDPRKIYTFIVLPIPSTRRLIRPALCLPVG